MAYRYTDAQKQAIIENRIRRQETIEVYRQVASVAFLLPTICEIPECRRANFCCGPEAQCLRRYKWVYQPILPRLHAALQRRLAKDKAEKWLNSYPLS